MIIAFDLDGTISDPIVGTAASINYALSKLGFPPKSQTEIKDYIGPSLTDIFAELLGKKDEQRIHAAINYFRERYFNTASQKVMC
jgi:phosphoglycolate phosphatase